MRYIFLLSKEDLRLAKEEALSLFNIKEHRLVGNLLFLDLDDAELAGRLAYTKRIYQSLFEAGQKDILDKTDGFDWQSIYKKDFCVRKYELDNSIENGLKEKEIASHIWRKLKRPRVNLTRPKTGIDFFICRKRIYAARLVKELKQKFESRKAHKRPELHPTSLNPKLARALINLSGARKEVVDPFCGAGGILIEAGLIGLKIVGYDLYKEMIDRARINLEHYKIKGYRLINDDALKIRKKYDYIVTDLPYGLNTSIWVKEGRENRKISLKQTDRKKKVRSLEGFYLGFLVNLKRIVRKRAVVVFPHYVNYRKLLKKAGFRIDKEFSQFIHGSLTRKIVVLG
ncbi:methyltransferase domain-containing protein [Candidatus Woesearchaeota archaeon]|nr:methyltransferase domain-containing protein [Candidatus Woesearchaeota archaeon]